jgi:uncharacterized membrane protein
VDYVKEFLSISRNHSGLFHYWYALAGLCRQRFLPQATWLSDAWLAALIFYLIFIAGLLIFGVLPAIEKGSLTHALIYGGLFGFFCYATFDLTSYALIRDFPLKVVIVDLLWGTALSATVAAASFFIGQKFIFS